ncbi:MAG: LamG-like jellyroll fold domain-containing protein [Methanomassiliicoccales archaeon]
MRTKALAIALIAILSGAMVTGGSIFAYIADVEPIAGNEYSAGTLNLSLGGSGTIPAALGPVYPGWGTSQYPSSLGTRTTFSVSNSGTINGVLHLNFTGVTNNENGITDPEGKFNLVLGDGGDTTPAVGELGQCLFVSVNYGSTQVLVPTVLNNIGSSGILLGNLPAGGTQAVTITYYVPTAVGNIIQSDLVAFNLVFDLMMSPDSVREVGPTGMDLSQATAFGSPKPAISWPLVLNLPNQQGLLLPSNASLQPVQSLTIEAKFMLDLPAIEQTSWSSLLDKNGDNGYRLQLSGSSTDNRWIEFALGNSQAWIRSNGMRSFSEVNSLVSGNFNVVLRSGVWYTVVATYDISVGKMQLYVNNTAGVLQLAGEMPYANAFSINSSPLYIGAYGVSSPTRGYFDGTIQYIAVKAT